MKALLALFAFMQVTAFAQAPNPADFPQQKQLAPNVYVWSDVHPSGLYTTNDLIVVTTDGVLVADGQKDPETTKKMVDGIAKLTKQPIKLVVIGSEHGDHTGGNASFPSTVTYIKSPLASGKETTLRSNHIFPNMRAAVPAEWIQTVKALRAIDANTVIPATGRSRTARR